MATNWTRSWIYSFLIKSICDIQNPIIVHKSLFSVTEAPCSIPLHENKFCLLAFLSKTSPMIDTNVSRSYILQQRRIHPGVQMSRTIWNKFPNTIKQADNLISSKYEFHWTMLNQHSNSIFQNSKKIFYLFIWWLLGQIHENVGISIPRNHLKRFQ